LSPLPRIPRNVQPPKIILYKENIVVRDHISEGDSDRSACHNGWWKCEHCRGWWRTTGRVGWEESRGNFGTTHKRVGMRKFTIYALPTLGVRGEAYTGIEVTHRQLFRRGREMGLCGNDTDTSTRNFYFFSKVIQNWNDQRDTGRG
jgi:hypothetical protein